MKKITQIISTIIIAIISIQTAYSLTAELIQTNPAPALAGEYTDITIKLIEKSNTAQKNVYITPKETNFLLLPENQEKYISEITNDLPVTRTFKIFIKENTPEGLIELPIKILSNNLETESKIEFYVQNSLNTPDIRFINGETIPKELLQDTKDNKILLKIQNLGEKEAKLIRATITFAENSNIKPSYPGSLTNTIAILNPNEIGTFEFYFDIEKNANKNFEYKIQTTYLTENPIGNELDKIEFNYNGNFKLSNAPKIEITNIEYLTPFEINSKGNKIKLTLKNTGQADAEDIKLKVTPDVSYPFEFDKLSQFIGYSIPKGETATAIIELNILKDAQEKKYSTKIIIDSLIGDNRYSQNYNLQIPVNKSTTIFTPTIIGLIVITLTIITSTIIGLGKRKHKKK